MSYFKFIIGDGINQKYVDLSNEDIRIFLLNKDLKLKIIELLKLFKKNYEEYYNKFNDLLNKNNKIDELFKKFFNFEIENLINYIKSNNFISELLFWKIFLFLSKKIIKNQLMKFKENKIIIKEKDLEFILEFNSNEIFNDIYQKVLLSPDDELNEILEKKLSNSYNDNIINLIFYSYKLVIFLIYKLINENFIKENEGVFKLQKIKIQKKYEQEIKRFFEITKENNWTLGILNYTMKVFEDYYDFSKAFFLHGKFGLDNNNILDISNPILFGENHSDKIFIFKLINAIMKKIEKLDFKSGKKELHQSLSNKNDYIINDEVINDEVSKRKYDFFKRINSFININKNNDEKTTLVFFGISLLNDLFIIEKIISEIKHKKIIVFFHSIKDFSTWISKISWWRNKYKNFDKIDVEFINSSSFSSFFEKFATTKSKENLFKETNNNSDKIDKEQ